MGRYNIPKEDSKELIKDVQNSSKGDSGKYGYYDISLFIRDIAGEYGEFKSVIETFLLNVNNIEITAIFLLHYTAGVCAFSKINIALLMLVDEIESQIDGDNAKAYIKVDENDMKMTFKPIGQNIFRTNYKGNMIDRFISQGVSKEEVEAFLIPITKEEYERYAIEVDETIGL